MTISEDTATKVARKQSKQFDKKMLATFYRTACKKDFFAARAAI